MKFRSAEDVFQDYLSSDPANVGRFAEREIALAVTRLFTRLRKDPGLNQEQLALRLGRTQPYIAKLEGGAYDRCALPTLRTFARALGHDIDVEAMLRPGSSLADLDNAPVYEGLDAELQSSPVAGEASSLQAALAQSLSSSDSPEAPAALSEPQTAAA